MKSLYYRILVFLFALSVTNQLWSQEKASQELPANTWVRFADCPGDGEGREVPPGRGSTWVYCPPLKGFLRYGGYTPRFSNAIDFFDPAANTWTDLKLTVNPPYRNCKYGLTYDEKNDVAILVGGQIGWNGPSCNDIWIFDVKKSEWQKMEPQYLPNEKEKLVLGESLMADYDSRHEVVILRSNSGFWAYRYKK